MLERKKEVHCGGAFVLVIARHFISGLKGQNGFVSACGKGTNILAHFVKTGLS